jgi:integrase
MSNYLEKRRQLYYAVLTVPKELQGIDGLPSLRFVKSTGTPDKRKAIVIASQYVAGWKLQIEQARGNDTGLIAEAIQFRKEIEKAKSDEYRETLESVLTDRAESIERSQGILSAKQYYGVATGTQTPHSIHYDNWKAQLTISPRTIEQYSKDVNLFIEQFPTIEAVTKNEVRQWLDRLASNAVTKNTQKRIVKGCHNYWRFLSTYGIKGMVENPFLGVFQSDKGKIKPRREVFEPHEIIELWSMAKDAKEDVLADLIVMAAYTGARIDELCSLMVKDVTENAFSIIASKTYAGIRDVPIHSHIKPTFKRLKENSKDGYLLPDLALDRFGDRSNTMSSRFSKLKINAGHGRLKVFHSLRHTLMTDLSNAGVIVFHIADIVGHVKDGATGIYVHTTDIEVKRIAIEKISFPFPILN